MQHLVSSLSVSDRPVHRLRENCRAVGWAKHDELRPDINSNVT